MSTFFLFESLMEYDRVEFVMLVGVPGSGKSTWIWNFLNQIPEGKRMRQGWKVLSSDAFIERIAVELESTYDAVFSLAVKPAQKRVILDLKDALDRADSIIWDQTNLTAKNRRGKLQQIPKHYHKTAVYFPTPELEEWKRRLASRPGKTIPEHVLEQMAKDLEIPTLDEGFDKIEILK